MRVRDNMKHKKLSELKVGDWCWSIQNCWARFSEPTDEDSFYLCGGYHYYEDGSYYADDKNPSLYTYNPFDKNDKPPCEFKKGEIIMVKDYGGDVFKPMKFYSFDGEHYIGWNRAKWDMARKLTHEERGE